MSVWSGWQADLLNAGKFPNSSANRAFLTAWHNHATSNCALNPVDISKQTGKWTACKHLDAGRTANNYGDQQSAEDAFKDQIRGTEYLALPTGLFNSSLDPTNTSPAVIAEIRVWGSARFADYLSGQAATGSGGGIGGKSVGIHRGWTDLRNSVNQNLPGAFRDSQKLSAQALRSLAKARKVKL